MPDNIPEENVLEKSISHKFGDSCPISPTFPLTEIYTEDLSQHSLATVIIENHLLDLAES